jgi:hypothetical protein
MVAAMDAQECPIMALQRPGQLSTGNRFHTAISKT